MGGLIPGQEVEIQGRLSTRTVRLESGQEMQISYVVAKNVDFGKRPKSLHDDPSPHKQRGREP